MIISNGKIFDVCFSCGEIIQLNKFLFGSLHICASEEERNMYANQILFKYNINKNRLDKSIIK